MAIFPSRHVLRPDFLTRAIEYAVKNVERGGGPFGAVVELPDGSWAAGVNSVTREADPTAHAEVVAIRTACKSVRSHDLRGAWLYTSCAPCPMCLSAAMWANVGTIVFTATPSDAADAGFSDALFYHELATVGSMPKPRIADDFLSFARLSSINVIHRPHPRALEPFEAWAAKTDKVPY